MQDNETTAPTPNWRIQLLWLLVLAVLGTLPFWLTELDIRAAAVFYHPQADNPWYEASRGLWRFFYIASPLLSGLVMLASILVLAGGSYWARLRRLRLYALSVLLAAVLGPGLVVNGILKDHSGRARPHQVEALGGTQAYLPPLALGEPGKGKSFPCGHSSVGFMLGVFFLIWRRRRPRLAFAALAGAILLGTLMGVGRMAAGDHFLSDVIWSGVIAYGVAMLVYFALLRVPAREAAAAQTPAPPHRPPRHPVLVGSAYGLVAVATLAGVLLATPVHDNHKDLVRASDLGDGPHRLRVEADMANVIVYWMDGADPALIRLSIRGFGVPGSRVEHAAIIDDGSLTYRIAHNGVFAERDTKLVLGLVSRLWDRVEVAVDSGDIRVQSAGAQAPELDLKSGDGSVVRE